MSCEPQRLARLGQGGHEPDQLRLAPQPGFRQRRLDLDTDRAAPRLAAIDDFFDRHAAGERKGDRSLGGGEAEQHLQLLRRGRAALLRIGDEDRGN